MHRELARTGFGIIDKLFDRMGRRRVRHEHEIDKLGDKRDWRKICNGIVAERTIETGVRSKGRGAKQDRVSIWIGPRSILVADVGACTSFVLNENLLVPQL